MLTYHRFKGTAQQDMMRCTSANFTAQHSKQCFGYKASYPQTVKSQSCWRGTRACQGLTIDGLNEAYEEHALGIPHPGSPCRPLQAQPHTTAKAAHEQPCMAGGVRRRVPAHESKQPTAGAQSLQMYLLAWLPVPPAEGSQVRCSDSTSAQCACIRGLRSTYPTACQVWRPMQSCAH